MRKLLFFAALLFAAVSCAETGIEEITPTFEEDQTASGELIELFGDDVSVVVSLDDSATRVSVDTSGDTWVTTWDEGDALHACLANASYSFGYFAYYTMSSYDPKESVFTGTTYDGYSNRRFVYAPDGNYAYTFDNDHVLYQYVTIDAQTEGLNSTFLIEAELTDISVDNGASPIMKHVGAAMALNIRFEDVDDDYTLTGIEMLDIRNKAYVNLNESIYSDSFYSAATYTGSIIVDLETSRPIVEYNSNDETTQECVKFNILPFEIASDEAIGFKVYFKDSDGHFYYIEKEIENTTGNTVSFERATYNTINSICSLNDKTAIVTSVELTLADIDADNIPEATTWIITDTEATTEDFAGFIAAVQAYPLTLDLSVEFPNLTATPDYAFYGCYTLETISLPKAITIGEGTFISCDAIKTISLPEATTIGNNAFSYCDVLETVSLPEATTIETNAFSYCYVLETVSLPKATTIGGQAFTRCTALKTFDIASTVTEIGAGAFYGCSSLAEFTISDNSNFIYEEGILYSNSKSHIITALNAAINSNLTLSDTVLSIGDYAFNSCTNLVSINMPKVTSIGGDSFLACSYLETMSAPEVTTIGSYAFLRCTSLSSVNLPLVTTVYSSAFAYCTSLTSIDMPLVTSVDSYAFYYCSSLSSVSLATGDGVQLSSIGSLSTSAFVDLTTTDITLTLGSANSSFVSGNTLTVDGISETFKEIIIDGEPSSISELTLADIDVDNIPEDNTWIITDTTATTADFAGFSAAIEALNDSGRQISLEFPNLEAIPAYAIFGKEEFDYFFGSDALVSVKADVATTVGDYAFYCCSNLSSISLPEVTSVGFAGLSCCARLTSIELPKVVSIGESAFSSCSSLRTFDIAPTVTEIGAGAFALCSSLSEFTISGSNFIFEDGILYNSSKSYVVAALIAVITSDLTLGDTVLTIGGQAFAYCSNLTSITLPKVTSIEDSAFSGCSYLVSASAPEVTSIDGSAFASCTRLSSVSFPEVTSIGTSGFNGCTSLTSIDLPKATSIGFTTFFNCLQLVSINLPEATTIEDLAFYVCTKLASVELPNVTSLGGYAFGYCSELASVKLPKVTSLGECTFYNCTSLAELSVATSSGMKLEDVSAYAFADVTTTNIDLTVGSENQEYVSGSTLSVGKFSGEFKAITIADSE